MARAIIIMAGGTGERFWPLSRKNHPKQLLALSGSGKSLLAETIDRASALAPRDRIFVATSRILQPAIREAKLGIPDENVLAEPCKRNTLGCILYATASILAMTHDAPEDLTLGFMAADARIPDEAPFIRTVQNAFDAAVSSEDLVTIGITPLRPETGYGYIEVSEKVAPEEVASVRAFREKPDRESAEAFLAAGTFLWNSGMFFWKASSFVRELELHQEQVACIFHGLTEAIQNGDDAKMTSLFETLPNISIDYALIEKTRRIRVVHASFTWDDLGAWDSLERTFPADVSGNVTVGEPILVDTTGSIVYNAPGSGAMAVGVLGMKDVVVVVSKDAVLVLPKERAQEVKKLVTSLQEKNAPQV